MSDFEDSIGEDIFDDEVEGEFDGDVGVPDDGDEEDAHGEEFDADGGDDDDEEDDDEEEAEIELGSEDSSEVREGLVDYPNQSGSDFCSEFY